MRRRLLLVFSALLAVILVGILALPLWFGAAVHAAGGSRGLTFARYERIGYGRFALHDVEFRRANVHVTAKRAEVDTPVLWLWRHWRAAPTNVVVGDWSVNVTKSTAAPSTAPTESGWGPLRQTLVRVGAQLDRWLLRAQAANGIVRWPGGELTLAS
ncbi:MAG TPA: hypothetical protein VM029_00490, partial [Opitutaceae bacterium]|nr:hypothetical protein [Opitutaceae bacterium]